ncbi:MAG: spore coat protein [Nanoarchaeota archaeon]
MQQQTNINEKDAMMDLLMQEKEIMKVYGSYMPEGSTTDFRGLLSNNLKVLEAQQLELFFKMKDKGYYQVKDAKQQDINDTKNQYSGS